MLKNYIANGKCITDYEWLQLINCCKLSTKLANPSTSSRSYWSILKTFVNGKKIPIISPLLVNGKFATNFFEKANLFNQFFSKQCQPLPKSNTYHTEAG